MDEFTAIEKTIRQQQNRYYGKYRAFVADNQDPETRGRCKLTIPSVLGETVSDWALPCFAYGGGRGFGVIAVPPAGAQVVAEFMEGDISTPLWTGAFWRTSDEVPEDYAGTATKVMKTESGHLLIFDDTEGEETVILRSSADAVLEMKSDGSAMLTGSDGCTVILDSAAGKLTVSDANGNSIVMSSSGTTVTDSSGNEIAMTSSGITVTASATITIEGSSVAVGGSGGEPLIKGTTFLSLFNAHTHNCTAPGAPTGPPLPPLTPSVLTTKSTAL